MLFGNKTFVIDASIQQECSNVYYLDCEHRSVDKEPASSIMNSRVGEVAVHILQGHPLPVNTITHHMMHHVTGHEGNRCVRLHAAPAAPTVGCSWLP